MNHEVRNAGSVTWLQRKGLQNLIQIRNMENNFKENKIWDRQNKMIFKIQSFKLTLRHAEK